MHNQIKTILENAGEILMQFYSGENIKISNKIDDSPVTNADIASHNYIVENLQKITNFPIVSEENFSDLKNKYKKFWILDPLDGTKEFIKHNGEFCICLALIDNNTATEGYIYNPINKKLYYSNENSIQKHQTKMVTIALSRSHSEGEKEILNKVIGCNNYKIVYIGSAIKFCEMIEGNIDIYLRFAPCKEWDTAAGQAIIEKNGFTVIDLVTKKTMFYNKNNFVNNPFIAFSNDYKNIANQIFEAL